MVGRSRSFRSAPPPINPAASSLRRLKINLCSSWEYSGRFPAANWRNASSSSNRAAGAQALERIHCNTRSEGIRRRSTSRALVSISVICIPREIYSESVDAPDDLVSWAEDCPVDGAASAPEDPSAESDPPVDSCDSGKSLTALASLSPSLCPDGS